MANPCKVCSNDEIRKQVDRLISEKVTDEGISKALASVGVTISDTSILRHRQNHYQQPDEMVELPEGMAIPRKATITANEPLGDAPARLLDEIRANIDNERPDLTKNRLVRESLLNRIMESQLAIVATALDRYQQGEGRYPLDMVKGLQTIGSLFEKTLVNTKAESATIDEMFERELQRLESVAFNEARELAEKGASAKVLREALQKHLQPYESSYPPGYRTFRFGGKGLEGPKYNLRINDAWESGKKSARKLVKASVPPTPAQDT